jgi:uncharacterized membrane protein YiaA
MNIDAIIEAVKIISAIAATASLPVKLIVDAIRMNFPAWRGEVYAASAFVLGIVFAIGALYIAAPVLSGRDVVIGLLAGLLTGALAVAATEAHKSAQAARNEAKAGQG